MSIAPSGYLFAALLTLTVYGVRSPAPLPSPTGTATSLEAWKAHLEHQSRDGSWWWTSNAEYAAADGIDAYATHFLMVPSGTAERGCLWGIRSGAATGVFWYFYSAWDAAAGAPFFHQSAPSGATGMGTGWTVASESHTFEQAFRFPDGTVQRIEHRATRIGRDTVVTATREWTDGNWIPRRTYIWVRQARAATPCQ